MTKRTRKPSLVAAGLMAMTLLSGTVTVARSEEPLDPMGASDWTGTFTATDAEGTQTEQSGYTEMDQVVHGTVDADDPRISGAWTQANHVALTDNRVEGAGPAGIVSGTTRIENDEGAWAGAFSAYFGTPGGLELHVLEGEGAYEGLTAVFRLEDGTFAGVIVPFEVPTTPDAVPPTAE
jgi:hypothetical protein